MPTPLFIVYWLITAAAAALLLRYVLHERDWKLQVSAALALIPLLLRVLLLK